MKREIIAFSLLLGAWLGAGAQEAGKSLSDIKPTVNDIYTQGGNLNISLTLDLSGLQVGKNEEVTITPVIKGNGTAEGAEFGSIVVKGRNASILSQRHGYKKTEADVTLSVTDDLSELRDVTFTGSVPYEQWMDNSTLYLAEDLCGCGALQSQDIRKIATFLNEPVVLTETVSAIAEPEVEASKIRYEKGSAFIDFIVNRYNIDPDYRNNKAELDRIISTIDVVRNDRNVSITNIDIHGYASPEGAYSHNAFLAEKRTAALADYVMRLYSIPKDLFSEQSTPENWSGLRELVEGSDLAEKEVILAVIDNGSLSPDEKDLRIKRDFPETYPFMLKNWYPSLRKSDYVITYEVRPFTPEEALEIMKVTPTQVSLYEMFRAAQTLDSKSEEFNEAIQIAVDTYPENPVARYNAAVVAVNKGDYAKAKGYLDQVPETAGSLNLLGVIALNGGDLNGAEEYFNKAASQGNSEAKANLQLIESLRNYRRQNR